MNQHFCELMLEKLFQIVENIKKRPEYLASEQSWDIVANPAQECLPKPVLPLRLPSH